MTIMYDHPLIQSRLSSTSFIWYTPAQAWDKLIHILKKGNSPSFLVVGDSDPYYKEERHKTLKGIPSYKELIIEGAGHLLENEKDIAASVDNIKNIMKILEKILKQDFLSAKQDK